MCVIIYKPAKQQITEEEVRQAWTVNPDGAGYAYINAGKVIFKRGFMNVDKFWQDVQNLQKFELVLHFRISTCAGITPQGTHPYKLGNVNRLSGTTTAPVIAMNGVINGQPLHTKRGNQLNDTASYIIDHKAAFNVINQDILNLIAENTDCRWAAATPEGVIISSNFKYENGLYYSNLNHKTLYYWYNDIYDYECAAKPTEPANNINLNAYIDSKKLLNQLRKDPETQRDLQEFIRDNCLDWNCDECHNCIYNAKTIWDIYEILDSYYITRRY